MPNVWEQTKLYARLKHAKHGVILIVGTGQWGKTVTANILCNIPPLMDRDVALINYPPAFVKKCGYPARYRAVRWPDEMEDIPRAVRHSRDVLIIDDAAFLVGARDSGTRSNKSLQKFITISSHMELFIILTIQNTSMLDISAMQSQDLIILHKHMDARAISLERDEDVTDQIIANAMIEDKWHKFPEVNRKAWTWCSSTYEMLKTDPPAWWIPEMSKPYMSGMPL